MNYQNKTLIAYLLGTLPAAETEHFDELSFTDDEFAEALRAAEKDLIDAFVQGELPSDELEKFNSFFLVSSLRREKVEFAKAFQIYAGKNIKEISAASKPHRTRGGLFAALKIFAAPHPFLQWGFAAAILALIFFGGRQWLENDRLREQSNDLEAKREALSAREQELQIQLDNERTTNSETEKELAAVHVERELLEQKLKEEKTQKEEMIAAQKQTVEQPPVPIATVKPRIAFFVLTPALRGNSQIQSLLVSRQTDFLALRVELEADSYPAYRVALVDQTTNRTLWQSGKLKTKKGGANNALNVRFPAKLVKPQIYSVEVSGIGAGGLENISSYPFKVVQK